ncbi:hypothetical protein [Aquimarina muelleri]|uniref:Lipoprotein n=1 Tax=Aquimarina muelleri TaxID=279356 RepID=A0A918N1W5_9FLAO|nr:hypothetical protein [Aquimarina muelleri]MCX2761651.1 hypothetical protein [Aquimarina muelleri]GGX07329.1 hypothetical protein GCM10007384_06130 [Aquimarina muelleri]
MLKKYTAKFLILLTLLSLTSCFEILEEVNLNKDGSGDFTLTVNLSQSKSKITSIMLLDSVSGHKIPSKKEVQKGMNDVVTYLQKTEGIYNISKKEDYENYVFSVRCSFKDITSINKLTKEVLSKQKVKIESYNSYQYNTSKEIFTKSYTYDPEILKQYNKLNLDSKKVFENALYTSIYRFYKEILSVSNTKVKISKSKKAAMLKINIIDLLKGTSSSNTKIQLAK